MDTEPKPVDKPQEGDESKIFGKSVRSLITVIIVGTVCVIGVMAAVQSYLDHTPIVVIEPLATLVGMAIGHYFAQRTQPKT